MIAFFDGRFVPLEELKLSCADRGFLLGDGVYATLRLEDGHLFFPEIHLARLNQQCAKLRIDPPQIELESVHELIEKNSAFKGLWKMQIIVTGGELFSPGLPKRRGHLLVTLRPHASPSQKPIEIGCYNEPILTPHSSFKSLANLNRAYIIQEAFDRGFDDMCTMTPNQDVLECAYGNLFWLDQKKLMTPDPSLPLYFGVTITVVCEIMREWGYSVQTVKESLPTDRLLYRTNTLGGVVPVERIETSTLPVNADIARRLNEAILERAKSATLAPFEESAHSLMV